ncbi:hypothetical protein AYO44_02450 [Planctomycetaceae bacterium SCGC AG-212-F19]|nr:hypothetical protein AYO44_02450 [Planctomycetaceae bacterium SCGC AG-212-F19]
MHFPIDRRTFLTTASAGLACGNLLAQQEPKVVEGAPEKPDGLDANRPKIEPIDYINRVHVQFSDSQRFGLVCPKLRDPRKAEKPKILTRDERGITNNTIVRIEGYEYLYGIEIPGVRYVKDKGKIMKEVPIPGKDKDRAWQSIWESEFGRIRITQSVEIIIGEQTKLYDTALVRYHIWNRDREPHTVGLRVMLDTFIGATDGVPFYVAPTMQDGRVLKPAHFIDKMEVIAQKDMPQFIQALESPDLADPNAALARVGVNLTGVEPVEKLVICRWPQNSEARWGGGNGPGEWQYEAMDKNPTVKDSCVLLYWAQSKVKSDEHRDLAFTYGLGRVPADGTETVIPKGGKIRLFTGPSAVAEKPFVLFGYVKGDAKTKVRLKLPEGWGLAPGSAAEQAMTEPNRDGYGQVTWLLTSAKPGRYVVEAEAADIGTAGEVVEVRDKSIFE